MGQHKRVIYAQHTGLFNLSHSKLASLLGLVFPRQSTVDSTILTIV